MPLAFPERVDEFLEIYEQRKREFRFPQPTMVVVSYRRIPRFSSRLTEGDAVSQTDTCKCSGAEVEMCNVFQQALKIATIVDPLIISLTADTCPLQPGCWQSHLAKFMELGYELRGSMLDASEFGFQRQQSHFRILFSKIGLPYTLGRLPPLPYVPRVLMRSRKALSKQRGYSATIRLSPKLSRLHRGKGLNRKP